jgi:Family of unknown function (DUF6228)
LRRERETIVRSRRWLNCGGRPLKRDVRGLVTSAVRIESAIDEVVLTFSHRRRADRPEEPGWFRFTFESSGLTASREIDTYFTSPLPEFFTRLAQHSTGWDGIDSYSTHNGVLSLQAEYQTKGSVVFRVMLNCRAEEPAWTLLGKLELSASELIALSGRIDAFWNETAT